MSLQNRLRKLEGAAARQPPPAVGHVLTLEQRAAALVNLARRVAAKNGMTAEATAARFREAARLRNGGKEEAALWVAVCQQIVVLPEVGKL